MIRYLDLPDNENAALLWVSFRGGQPHMIVCDTEEAQSDTMKRRRALALQWLEAIHAIEGSINLAPNDDGAK